MYVFNSSCVRVKEQIKPTVHFHCLPYMFPIHHKSHTLAISHIFRRRRDRRKTVVEVMNAVRLFEEEQEKHEDDVDCER